MFGHEIDAISEIEDWVVQTRFDDGDHRRQFVVTVCCDTPHVHELPTKGGKLHVSIKYGHDDPQIQALDSKSQYLREMLPTRESNCWFT
jgi:hypothetical protein